jgi:hypothetical protein
VLLLFALLFKVYGIVLKRKLFVKNKNKTNRRIKINKENTNK